MSGVSIPVDEESERICAGLASIGRRMARVVLDGCDARDCYLPAHRRILEHALDPGVLAAEDAADAADGLEVRLVALADAANVPLKYLRELVALDAAYGRRFLAPRLVAIAARKRRVMQCAADLYNFGSGLTGEDLSAITTRIAVLRDEIRSFEIARPCLIVLNGGSAA